MKEKVISTPNGCKQIREASDIRNDTATKRIKLVAADSDFYYHMSNKCYKKYTNSTLLQRFRQREELQNASPSSSGTSRTATRTQSTACSSPNPISTRSVMHQMNCIICHQRSHKREFNKFRISEDNRVTSFLEAANYFQDDVFGRICDLQDEHAVFGADLYYHKHCMTIYLQKYSKASRTTDDPPTLSAKQRAWNNIVLELEVGLNGGNGFELSAIRDKLNRSVDEGNQFRSRDVKIYLVRQFGSSIDFTYPDVMRKSLMVYSVACNRPDAFTEHIRFKNPAQVCASVLRNSLESHDFDLDDRFGDAQDLRHACSSMSIPEPILRFLGYLYNFNPRTYPKAAAAVMMDTVPTEDDGDDEESTDEDEHEHFEQTASGCLFTQRCRKIQALFQTMYYIHHCGRKRTPMQIMNAESAHSLGRGGKILTKILNHQDLSLSYAELRRYQYDIATYTAQQNEDGIALPAHFDPGQFTSAGLDNWDHEGANVSEHDTVCVLYQNKPVSQTSKQGNLRHWSNMAHKPSKKNSHAQFSKTSKHLLKGLNFPMFLKVMSS